MNTMDIEMPVVIERQPGYTTCGPTSLHAIYHYYEDPLDLRTGRLSSRRSCSVRHFDPTWFHVGRPLTGHRVIGAICLGTGSDDGNLIRIRPKGSRAADEARKP